MKLNLDNPTLTFSKPTILKNGQEIAVMGSTFKKSIMPMGDPMYSMVNLVDLNGDSIGLAFFRDEMTEDELREKVENMALYPDQYLSPGHKQKIEN